MILTLAVQWYAEKDISVKQNLGKISIYGKYYKNMLQ